MEAVLWEVATWLLCVGIAVTLVPVVWAFLKRVKLHDGGPWFGDTPELGDQQARLLRHHQRILGTLVYWKNRAAAHRRLHLARVAWSLISAVALPVLVQFHDRSSGAMIFMTLFTTWTGLVVACAFTFKSEEQYQGFRRQESDYYDVTRRLLDFSSSDPMELRQQVDEYFEYVEAIRKVARRVETGSPPSAL